MRFDRAYQVAQLVMKTINKTSTPSLSFSEYFTGLEPKMSFMEYTQIVCNKSEDQLRDDPSYTAMKEAYAAGKKASSLKRQATMGMLKRSPTESSSTSSGLATQAEIEKLQQQVDEKSRQLELAAAQRFGAAVAASNTLANAERTAAAANEAHEAALVKLEAEKDTATQALVAAARKAHESALIQLGNEKDKALLLMRDELVGAEEARHHHARDAVIA